MLQLNCVRGIDDVWPVQIRDQKGQPMTSVFTGAETLACDLWAGDDQSVLARLPAVWDTPSAGTVKISIPGLVSAQIAEGLYQGLLRLADNSEALARFSLDIRHAPGTVVDTITPYCSYGAMQLAAPWVKLVQSEEDVAGFLEQRIEARRWLDWVIINSYRGASVGLFEQHSTLAFVFGGGVGWRRSLGPSPSLLTYLQQDKLIVRPQISRVCALKAVSLIGLAQIGINNTFAQYGMFFRDTAERELTAITAEIDLNSDGIGELFVNLGSTNPLMT